MITRVAWLLLALLHLIPAFAMVRPALITRLYAIDQAAPAFPLVWHRAALFAVITIIAVWAAFRPEVRPLALVAVSLSMASFLAIYFVSGSPPALRTIAIADLVGLPFLLLVIVAQFRGGADLN